MLGNRYHLKLANIFCYVTNILWSWPISFTDHSWSGCILVIFHHPQTIPVKLAWIRKKIRDKKINIPLGPLALGWYQFSCPESFFGFRPAWLEWSSGSGRLPLINTLVWSDGQGYTGQISQGASGIWIAQVLWGLSKYLWPPWVFLPRIDQD